MQIKTVVTQANGIITLVLQPAFVGDTTDAMDKQLIAAFGDPEVNIGGSFTDPSNEAFTFQFPTTQNYVGVTTELTSNPVQFMLALPNGPTQYATPVQGPMSCITTNPSEAATAWQAVVVTRIQQAFSSLRAKTLVPTIPNVTI